MSGNPSPELPQPFQSRVAQAKRLLLALDYDGTLAPIRVARGSAQPLHGVVPALRALAANPATTVAVLSGRPISELVQLLVAGRQDELGRIQLIGEHGWEWLQRAELRRHALPAEISELLRRAAQMAADDGLSALIESKRTAVVFHTRGLPSDSARNVESRIRRLWSPLVHRANVKLDEINGGLELRAFGRNKGTALRELIAELPLETLVVYLGDDRTDEDAFQQIGDRGFGLRVGEGDSATAACASLKSCADVVTWLELLSRSRSDGGALPASRRKAP